MNIIHVLFEQKNKGAKIVILNKESTQFDTMAELLINADLEEIYERIK